MKKGALFIAISFILVACSTSPNTDMANEETSNREVESIGQVSIDGSSTVFPVTEAVAEEFYAVNPDIKVTVGLSGTGGGFKKFCRGETDVNDASRPIKETEIELCDSSGIDYVDFTVAYDGLAVIVHPDNDWVDELTVAELKMMWEPDAQGEITKWNQIRDEWPDEELSLYGPGTASGTFDYFTEAIVGEEGASRGDYTASEDDNVLVQGVASDKYALGFFGLAYYEENKDKLSLVPVNNGDEAVLPSEETVKNGTYSPLSRPLFIYLNDQALAREDAAEFTQFYLETAGELVSEVGYIPLTDEEYAAEMEKYETFLETL